MDVTDDELAEICADANNSCSGVAASVGSVGGSGGTGGSLSNPNGGTFNASGGTSNGGSFSNNGGTTNGGSSNGGTASGGSSGTGTLAKGECLPKSDITILYRNRADSTPTQEPSMVLSVQNTAGTPFDLTALAIRYWFTADGTSNFIPTVDYASIDRGSISVAFGQDAASGSNYAEMTFSSGGSIGSEGVQELQLRFHADPYQPLQQDNDFSFLAGASQLTPNPNITPYLNREQVGGCIPAP